MSTSTTIRVVVDEMKGAERSIRKFKRMCEAYGVVREYRKRQEYRKPSVRMKEKNEAADKRRRKSTVVRTGRSNKI